MDNRELVVLLEEFANSIKGEFNFARFEIKSLRRWKTAFGGAFGTLVLTHNPKLEYTITFFDQGSNFSNSYEFIFTFFEPMSKYKQNKKPYINVYAKFGPYGKKTRLSGLFLIASIVCLEPHQVLNELRGLVKKYLLSNLY